MTQPVEFSPIPRRFFLHPACDKGQIIYTTKRKLIPHEACACSFLDCFSFSPCVVCFRTKYPSGVLVWGRRCVFASISCGPCQVLWEINMPGNRLPPRTRVRITASPPRADYLQSTFWKPIPLCVIRQVQDSNLFAPKNDYKYLLYNPGEFVNSVDRVYTWVPSCRFYFSFECGLLRKGNPQFLSHPLVWVPLSPMQSRAKETVALLETYVLPLSHLHSSHIRNEKSGL